MYWYDLLDDIDRSQNCKSSKQKQHVLYPKKCWQCFKKPPVKVVGFEQCDRCSKAICCGKGCQKTAWHLGHKLICSRIKDFIEQRIQQLKKDIEDECYRRFTADAVDARSKSATGFFIFSRSSIKWRDDMFSNLDHVKNILMTADKDQKRRTNESYDNWSAIAIIQFEYAVESLMNGISFDKSMMDL